jgi:hypothetical protein
MANRATQSLTTGIKILGGRDIPTYTLEHLVSTASFRQGSFSTIAVPYIEIGRASNCVIRYGDDVPTVSRRHCAIERVREETFLFNLSKTNPTLINGRPVREKYFLNNGDEIQLSLEGPRIRYNATKSGTARMGFTNKMNLVLQQAIKPYKKAFTSVLAVLIIAIFSGVYAINRLSGENKILAVELDETKAITKVQSDSIAAINKQNQNLANSLQQIQREAFARIEEEQQKREEAVAEYKNQLEVYQVKSDSLLRASSPDMPSLLKPVKNKVLSLFLSKHEIMIEGKKIAEKDYGNYLLGTGFVMEGGIFVTARHCIDIVTNDDKLNIIDNSGGNVIFHFIAKSFDGSLNFKFTDENFRVDDSKDDYERVSFGGSSGSIRVPDYNNGSDWAYAKLNSHDGVPFDKAISTQLPSGTNLVVLGYSYGMDYRESGSLEPYYSTAKTALSGLQNGTIQITEAGFDGGNSGGPVFIVSEGKLKVVAIVTGTWLKKGGQQAHIQVLTPIGNIK